MADTGIRVVAPASSTALSTRKLSQLRLGELAQSAVEAEHSWRPVVRFRAPERWFHRLDLTEDYEIWLLSWLPGQHTGFHDHGDAHGAFAVADGELRETLATPGGRRIVERVARHRSLTRFGGRHLHDVGNVTLEPAVSVHVYSPPLSDMRRYQMTAAGLELTGTDRAEQDW
jgi:predicted metal-dependent enzyme (double-stranded beta helix superfamily)